MTTSRPLRLLGATNNARGDLFTRLTGDLFFALGYDELRFDVHKSGREIDIQGTHRLLPRRLVAECKAHADKMGGADLNKFFGVVGRERSKHKQTPVDVVAQKTAGEWTFQTLVVQFREKGERIDLLAEE